MTDSQTTDRTKALRDFLLASSEHTAAMYDLGFAIGAGNQKGPAERNLEETSAAFVSARAKLERAMV